MSRRQSRVSVDTRQNDTLSEFETFKKKFLLANKHITKLNSTLSVRIEELNAQISTLYVENLRLRASEIALTAQLKKERDKSRKIIADAEAATHNLMRHLGLIRKSFAVSSSTPGSSPPQQPPQPRARRPPKPDPNASPPPNRIARPPEVPGIEEEDENMFMANEDPYGNATDDRQAASPTPVRRKKSRASSSTRSSRALSPPPPDVIELPVVNFDDQSSKLGKRKPTRRQSGLLTTSMSITTLTPKGYSTEVIPPRPSSPAFGSPLRLEAALQEEEEMNSLIEGDLQDDDEPYEPSTVSVTKRDKKRKSKEKEYEEEEDEAMVIESSRRERDRRRSKAMGDPGSPVGGKKPKLKDVTNAPPPRPSLLSIQDRDRETTPDSDQPTPATSTASASSFATARTFLTTPTVTSKQDGYLPSPRASSPAAESDPNILGGRERRIRKSINYAEPKLNTKMRKPDPQPSEKKRTSSASEPRRSLEAPGITPSSSSSTDSMAAPTVGVKRKKSRVYTPEDDESEGTQGDAETAGMRLSGAGGWMNVDGRRRSGYTGSSVRRPDGDEGRRHSMAV